MRESEQATGIGERRIDPKFPGFDLRSCRRLSPSLSRHPAVRRLWAGASRGMRQHWAVRTGSEIRAPLPGGVRVPVRLSDHIADCTTPASGRSIDEWTRFWQALDYCVGVIAGDGVVRWEHTPNPGSGHQNICCAPIEN